MCPCSPDSARALDKSEPQMLQNHSFRFPMIHTSTGIYILRKRIDKIHRAICFQPFK